MVMIYIQLGLQKNEQLYNVFVFENVARNSIHIPAPMERVNHLMPISMAN